MDWPLRVLVMVCGLALAAGAAWSGFVFIDDRPRSRAAEMERRQFAKHGPDPSGVLLISSTARGSWLLGTFGFATAITILVATCVLAFR